MPEIPYTMHPVKKSPKEAGAEANARSPKDFGICLSQTFLDVLGCFFARSSDPIRPGHIITGSLVILKNYCPPNYRYRYRLEIRMNSLNYHYRYRLGVRSHPFMSIDSQLPS